MVVELVDDEWEVSFVFDFFVLILKDGMVYILVYCLEMGIGICIVLLWIVVDELEVDWSWVEIV